MFCKQFSCTIFFIITVAAILPAQEDAIHQHVTIQQPAQRTAAAREGLANPWPEPVPSQGLLPLAIGIIPPIQVPAENWDVVGLRLNLLAGRHNNVAILDLGSLVNLSLGQVTGLEIAGLWNQVNQDLRGIQISGIANRVCGDLYGLQIAGIANYNGAAETTGLQIALVNINQGNTTGLQIGLYNQVESMSGVQIGLFNTAQNFYGMQLGLCNLIRQSPLPFMVILNFGF
ncbi:MAG: hypothetical protein WCT05_04465 [Lentisphaeria bacterium]